MGVVADVVRVACNTSTGTQNITGSLGGLTPKAAIFIVSWATADSTAVNHTSVGWGWTDGTIENSCAIEDEHGVGTTNGGSYRDLTTICIRIYDPTTSNADGVAGFSSWLTNGVQINWTTAPSSAYLMTVILLAGSDLSAHSNNVNLQNDQTAKDVTDPGFTPDLIFASQMDAGSAHVRYATGLVHYDGASTITQHCLLHMSEGIQATSAQYLKLRDDCGAGRHYKTGLTFRTVFSDFDANGFSVTPTDGNGGFQILQYLALSFGGAVDSWVGIHTTPTSTGNDSETGPGFTPQFVFMLESLAEATNSSYSDNRAGTLGFSAFDAGAEFTTIYSGEDGVGTTNTQSLADARAIVVPDDDGTLDIEATFVSFDTNGWTVNYSNAPATAKKFLALAIEAEAGGPTLQAVAGTLTSAGAIVKQTATDRAGTLTSSGAVATSRTAFQAIAGTLTSSGTATTLRTAFQAIAGTLTSTGAVIKNTATSLAGTLTSAGTLVKNTAVSVAGTLTTSGTVTTLRTAFQAIAGTLTTAGAVVKNTAVSVAGTLTSAGTVVKNTATSLAGTLSSSGIVAGVKSGAGIFYQAVAGTLTTSGAVVKATSTSVAGTLTTAGAVVKQTAKSYAGTLTSAGAIVKQAGKPLAGTLTTAGAIARVISKPLAGALTPTGTVSKFITLVKTSLAGTLTTAGAIASLLNPVTLVVNLTLKARDFGLTLPSRAFALSLKVRDFGLTLKDRGTS
jgi:hypothetical protein